jgi:hypothetical protein
MTYGSTSTTSLRPTSTSGYPRVRTRVGTKVGHVRTAQHSTLGGGGGGGDRGPPWFLAPLPPASCPLRSAC